MGRTKSWLALVLAIVMVLGMAVPTAFADDVVDPETAIKLLSSKTWSDGGGIASHTFEVGGSAEDFYVFDVEEGKLATEELFGVKPVVEILDDEGDPLDETFVKFTVGDGVISIAPVSMTYSGGVDVKIAYTVDDVEYDVYNLNIIVNPVVTAAAINMDTLSNPSVFLSPANFISTSVNATDKVIIQSADSSGAGLTSTSVAGGRYNLLATAKGEYVLTAKVVLGSSASDVAKQSSEITVLIPVHVGQAEAGEAYKFGTDKAAGVSIARDADEAARTFKVWFEDPDKTVLKPTAANPFEESDFSGSYGDDYGIVFERTDEKSVLYNDGTYGDTIGTLEPADDFLTTGKIVLEPFAKLVSAKGKVTIWCNDLLMTEFDLEITPIGLTVSTPITLDLAITAVGQTPAGATKYGNVTPAKGTYTQSVLWSEWDTESGNAPAGVAMNVYGSQLQFVATRDYAEVGTYKVKIMVGTKISNTLTVGTEIKEITVNVVDNTKVPKISVTNLDNPVALDPANAPTKTYNYTVQNSLSGNGTFTLGTPVYSPTSLESQIDVLTFSNGILTITADSNAVRSSGKITIKGTVDGVAIEPFDINVDIDDTTPGKPHHLVVTTPSNFTEISGKISEGSKYLVLKVVDYDGNAYNATTYSTVDLSADLEFASVDAKGADNGVVTLRTGYPNTSGQVYVDYAKVGTGKTVFSGKAGTLLAKIVDLEIPTTIEGMTLTADKSSVSLDIKNKGKDAGKAVITFSTTAGSTINSITKSIPAATANSYTVDVENTNGVWTATVEPKDTAVKNSKLVFNAKVDNFDATPITIPVTITGSKTLIASKDSMTFEMKEGGIRNAELVITSSPEGQVSSDTLAVGDPKIADKTIVEIAKTSSDYKSATYLVTALAKGTTTITFEGALSATGTLGSVTVDITVVDEVTEKTFVLAATPIALDLTTTKTSDVTWSVETGELTDVKVTAISGADYITISDDYKTITAKAAGTVIVQATGKVDGKDAKSNTVTITVSETPTTGAGVYIDGVLYATGDPLEIPNNWKNRDFKVTLKNADGAETDDVKLSLTVTTGNKKARLKVKKTNQLYPTLQFGKTNLTVTPNVAGFEAKTIVLSVQRLAEVDNSKVVLEKEDPQAGTRGFYFDYITTNTDKAYYTQPKFWKFTSGNTKRAVVKSNGIIEFKKAGKVTLKATKKSGAGNNSKVKSFSITLTITDEYVNTASWVAVLSDNTKAADVLTTLKSQNYPKGTTGTDAPFAYTEAGYRSMIDYLQTNAGENDVSAVYIGGTITKDGVALSDKNISLVELANDLAQVKGKIFLTLNGAGSTLYSSKDVDATPADIAKVFAAAEAGVQSKATALSTVGTNGFWSSQKFYVLSATQKKSQTSVSDTKADAVEEAFITALTLKDGEFFNGETSLTLRQLYNKVRTVSKKTIGYYPSAVKGVAVGYNYVP